MKSNCCNKGTEIGAMELPRQTWAAPTMKFCFDRGTKVVGSRRTSLIVDPPDGRIPPLTETAQKRVGAERAYDALHAFDRLEDRPLAERCILWPAVGPPMLPGPTTTTIRLCRVQDTS